MTETIASPEHGQQIRIGSDNPSPAEPCGKYEGEILVDTAGVYVGNMSGPVRPGSIQSGFTSGVKLSLGDPDICCGGVRYWQSPYWEPPWIQPECGGVDNYVPLSSVWKGFLDPEIVRDTSGPAKISASRALHFRGTGQPSAGTTFAQPVHGSSPGEFYWDYWHPEYGSEWVWEGWVRASPDVAGAALTSGFGIVSLGERYYTTATISDEWRFFRLPFTFDPTWSASLWEGLPVLPVLSIYGEHLYNPETRVQYWPTAPGSCAPHPVYGQAHEVTRAAEKGDFWFKCLHVYPAGAGRATINRRFGRE